MTLRTRHSCAKALLLASAALLLSACGGADETASEAVEAPALPKGQLAISVEELGRIGVAFAKAESAAEVPLATVPATLAPPPNGRVAVAAVIPGVVTRTMAVEGDSVRQGQPLAVIAARELLTLGAGVEQASARAEMARANNRRLAQLASEGVIAASRADEARAALREAEAELNEQRRLVRTVNGSTANGTYTLTAPISGRITTASITTGSPVNEATSAYVIDAASQYELTAQLPERLLGRVRPGMTVHLSDGVTGTVTSVGSVLDPLTRSATLRARVSAGEGVVAGRSVTATLYEPAPQGAVIVPASAIIEIDNTPSVFVRSGKAIAMRPVTVGERVDGRTVILSGLKAGDQVAVSGVTELKSIAGQN